MFYKQPGVWRISETDTGIERDRGGDKESANVELCMESRGFSRSGGRARHPARQHSLDALVCEASQWRTQNTSSTKNKEERTELWINPQSFALASGVLLNTDDSLITTTDLLCRRSRCPGLPAQQKLGVVLALQVPVDEVRQQMLQHVGGVL